MDEHHVTETDLLAFALDASAAQCEDYCRRLRNGDPVVSAADARRLHEGRSLVRHLREGGSDTISVELPREAMEVVLVARDRRCTFPGHHERFLEAHHVHHRADGGESSLGNLLLICSAHHTLITRAGSRRSGAGTARVISRGPMAGRWSHFPRKILARSAHLPRKMGAKFVRAGASIESGRRRAISALSGRGGLGRRKRRSSRTAQSSSTSSSRTNCWPECRSLSTTPP